MGDEKFDVLKILPISAWEWPKPILFVPIERTIPYASQVMPWIVRLAQQGVPWILKDYTVTYLARNRAAEELLKTDKTHIIMLDLDHIHPPDIVQRLSRWFIHDPSLQVVGGLNFKRGAPYNPCCFLQADDGRYAYPVEWTPGLIEVQLLGTGSVMIAREVFEKIEPPWFWYPYDEGDGEKYQSDDIGFSRKCNEAGIKLHVDTTTTSPHLTEHSITERTFREHLQVSGKDQEVVRVEVSPNGDNERVYDPGAVQAGA